MDFPEKQFGLIVAYLLPGFIGLGGIALLAPSVAAWLKPGAGETGWGIGPPLYVLLAALATGMIVSCFRWLIIDHLLAWTGVRPTPWDAERMSEKMSAFNVLIEFHYRYYQFYANAVVAIIWTYGLTRAIGNSRLLSPATDFGVLVLCIVLLAGARDALSKYYDRTHRLIGDISN